MDGSNAAFLLDPIGSSSVASRAGAGAPSGILYVEDFDAESGLQQDAEPAVPPAPSYTQAELDAAVEAGRQRGGQEALSESALLQSQLQTAALTSLTDALAAARASLEAVACRHAEETARTILAILQGAIPATQRAHAAIELRAILGALTPGLLCEPQLRVRAHPNHADMIREHLIAVLPAETCSLTVTADSTLEEGDITLAWQDGQAKRDCAALRACIAAALAPLRLPSLEEICHGGT
jgi:flagellar assembly protein FliH